MLRTHHRTILLGAALSLTLSLTACGGGEERQQKYLERAQKHFDAGNYDKARVDVKNVLQINPNNADAYFVMAQVEEKEQNWRMVFGNLNKAVELDPANLAANVKLGHMYIFAQSLDKAREQADLASALAPDDASVLGLQAAVEFREGNREAAEQHALAALQADPGEEFAISILAELYKDDRAEEALVFIEKGRSASPDSVPIRLIKIRILQALDRQDEVAAEYQQLIELYPENILYLGRLVDFYVAEGRPEQAEQLIRAQIESQPDRNQLKMLLARFLLMNQGGEAAVAELEKMLQEDPENTELRTALGGQLAILGEAEKAEAVFKGTFEFDATGPGSQTARNQLTQLAISQKNYEEAARWNAEALEVEPDNPEALANRGRLAMKDGEYTEAISDLRLALRASPESVPTLLLLADAQQKNRSINLALDNYREVLRLQPGNLIALYRSAVILSGQENYEEAEANIERILVQQPNNIMAINLLAEIQSRQQRWDDAQLLVDRLAANEQTAVVRDVMSARLELRQGNYDAAIELAKGALAQNDQLSSAVTITAQAYAAKEDLDGAIAYVEEYLARHPGSGDLYDVLAQLYVNNKQPDKAVAAYKVAIEQSPERIQSYINLARVLQFRGTPDEVMDIYKSGVASNPDNVLLKLELANRYQLIDDYQAALALLEEAHALDETSTPVKNNLASLLMDHFPTEENMRRAQELTFGFAESGNPALIDTLGWLQYKQGNLPQAIDLLLAAQKAGGNGADYWFHLGMAYYRNGQAELAREQLEKVIAQGGQAFYGRAEAEEALKNL